MFAVLGVLLALLSAVLIVAWVTFARAGNDVIYRWQPAAAASQRMLADLVNQETGVRGYALARQLPFLVPYTDYTTALRRDETRLDQLIGDDSRLRELYGNARQAAERWRSDVAEPVIRDIRAGRNPGVGALDAARRASTRCAAIRRN